MSSESKSPYGFCSMAPSIYDTAWLAMIEKRTDQGFEWLFPDSFEYLLHRQTEDGGWDLLKDVANRHSGYSENIWVQDCVVHSLAALCALCRHYQRASCHSQELLPGDLLRRIFRAKSFLDAKLQIWQPDGATHCTLELTVPVLIHLLHDQGVEFEFPAKNDLLSEYAAATSINLSGLYERPCNTSLSSLEGFTMHLEWDRLEHLPNSSGIASSPASTAAYLMYSPTWSDGCEAYLRHVLLGSHRKRNGGVAGVYPLEVFEPCWVLSTLLESGFTVDDLGVNNVDGLLKLIHTSMQNGVTGPTYSLLPSADDTSRALAVLTNNGYEVSYASLLDKFEGDDSFRAFEDSVRYLDPCVPQLATSVSINGNVLYCLLSSPDPSVFTSQIEKIVKFMCSEWRKWKAAKDPRNLSEYYSILNVGQSLVRTRALSDKGCLPALATDLAQEHIPRCLQEVLDRVLRGQNEDGSWGNMHGVEETAYAIIVLAHLTSHAAITNDPSKSDHAIARGKQFLLDNWILGHKPDRIWT
ncbi:hypothetical protein AbraIFM66951_012004 [Aspergillus brasiliensis]|uniref:Squalene cyclase C-terminal domain-containing protein n=1 Tax=Aspergillus brasiliensis TaxID=319629 RepID=A0A9W5YW19_9EURO|nr:hypothetical protein AbraCBS73388_011588 [Aspergillus brasiliensis]GKZ48241.1 hypothetical protein AbraIFM66951_012004 [Aspergillus brasiliensis]